MREKGVTALALRQLAAVLTCPSLALALALTADWLAAAAAAALDAAEAPVTEEEV